MASPVVQVRVPGDLLARVDAARGERSRSAWIIYAIGAALALDDPVTVVSAPAFDELAASLDEPAAAPPALQRAMRESRARRDPGCPHPKSRVVKGLCGACGTGGL